MKQPYFVIGNVVAGKDTTGYRIRVFDEDDNLICWCGPYLKLELRKRVNEWKAGGWIERPRKVGR